MPCEVHGDKVGRDQKDLQEDQSVLSLKYY